VNGNAIDRDEIFSFCSLPFLFSVASTNPQVDWYIVQVASLAHDDLINAHARAELVSSNRYGELILAAC